MNKYLLSTMFSIMTVFGGGQLAADFSGDFDPANWTLIQNGGNGSVNITGAPGSIALTGSNGPEKNGINTDYQITILQAGTISFDWLHTTLDSSSLQEDPFSYLVNEVDFIVSDSDQLLIDSGTISDIVVAMGDTFVFRVYTTDNYFGASTATISNFTFTPANTEIPEPSTYAILASSLAVCAYAKRRRLA